MPLDTAKNEPVVVEGVASKGDINPLENIWGILDERLLLLRVNREVSRRQWASSHQLHFERLTSSRRFCALEVSRDSNDV